MKKDKDLILFILSLISILMGVIFIPIGIIGSNGGLIYGGLVLIILSIKPTYKYITTLYRK